MLLGIFLFAFFTQIRKLCHKSTFTIRINSATITVYGKVGFKNDFMYRIYSTLQRIF